MDEIETRLRDVSDTCLKAYQSWLAAKKDPESREVLQDAIHELRKVSARLEIEIAVSEREEMVQRPIPIPPHRATRKRQNEEDEGDSFGNQGEGPDGNGPQPAHGGGQRNVLRRRSHGPGQGGGPRRGSEE